MNTRRFRRWVLYYETRKGGIFFFYIYIGLTENRRAAPISPCRTSETDRWEEVEIAQLRSIARLRSFECFATDETKGMGGEMDRDRQTEGERQEEKERTREIYGG